MAAGAAWGEQWGATLHNRVKSTWITGCTRVEREPGLIMAEPCELYTRPVQHPLSGFLKGLLPLCYLQWTSSFLFERFHIFSLLACHLFVLRLKSAFQSTQKAAETLQMPSRGTEKCFCSTGAPQGSVWALRPQPAPWQHDLGAAFCRGSQKQLHHLLCSSVWGKIESCNFKHWNDFFISLPLPGEQWHEEEHLLWFLWGVRQ